MNRRQFMSGLALGSLALAPRRPAAAKKKLAITMDDPRTDETPLLSAIERNRAILETLSQANLKAALFVCGKRVDNAAGGALLQEWDRQGHVLANHTYSHPYLPAPEVDAQDFIEDILRGEDVIADYSRFQRIFRFPFLKEGDTIEKRDGVRRFLAERDYRVGHVTIDASDWYVDYRMSERLDKDPGADLSPYCEFYLQHLWERATFYDDLATKVFGQQIQHTLLIHHSLLNALFLEDVLRMFEQRGWGWVDAADVFAFEDDVFSRSPDILPAGESIVWALAKQTGRFDDVLRYPGEDSRYEEAAMDRLGL